MQGRLSLRERLLVVLVAALLPLFAAAIWVAMRESAEATALAQSQLKFAASLLAANQDRTVEATEQMLGAVATMPELRLGGRERCHAYFAELHRRFAMYTNIGLIGPDGQVLCHALNTFESSLQDREYFRRAVATRRFTMGAPVMGRLSGRRSLPFALPVIEHGDVAAVVFATLDLAKATEALASVELPPQARVLVADREGRVLMEYPLQPGKPQERTASDATLLESARSLTPAGGDAVDAQGVPRIFALAPSRPLGDQGFVVRVGMARSLVTRGWEQAHDVLIGFLALMLLAMLSVWWVGGRIIVKPAKQIVAAVRRLEQGRLDARAPVFGGRGEFARIGAAFNLMAESLQMRQADLQAELGRSRGAYAVLDQVLNSMKEALIAVTVEGHFLMYNNAAARMFPMKDAPVLPSLWPGHFGFFHADGTTPYRADDLPLVLSALGHSGNQQQLFVRNALVPEGRILQCSWQPLQGGSVRGGLVVCTDVTELHRLQSEQAAQFAQLAETQRKLIEAQRIGRIGNWELDLKTGRMWWSDEAFALFGIRRDAFDHTLNAFEQLVHPDDRPLLKAARDSALRDGEGMSVEFRIVKPDGSIVRMYSIAEARRDESGEPVWFGGVVQDVTQRKRHEEQLRDSQLELQAYARMLQRATEAAHAITAQPTLQETLHEVAQQACQVLEASHASMTIDEGAGSVTHTYSFEREGREGQETGQAPLVVPIVDRAGQRKGELHVSAKKDGAWTQRDRYVALELAQLASVAIENARLFAQVRELNAGLESRIAERTEQLARQEQLYRTLAEQAPEVVWHTDGRGDVTYLNRAWCELVGGQPADWLGQKWFSRVHPDDREEVRRHWLQSRGSLAPFVGTRRILARDGTYHTMSYKAAPIVEAGGRAASWVGIDTDITQFKAIEGALRASNQELETFSYSVSHDLRAPLGAIGGFSRALEAKVAATGDEKAVHYLARIQAGVGKMEQLIESLLQLSRVVRAPLEWGEVDLATVAREALEGLQIRDAARRVSVDIEDGLVAHGDSRLLRLVMENLLGNAWKFTARTDAAEIRVGRAERNVFFVRDNGVGFEMAHAGKLFTAFQRLHTESEFPGTGIGLATVRRIIGRHQGRVWAESQPGQGTVFYFFLPETPPPAWLLSRPSALP
jgi:PAS domain S-box-containing protein